MFILFDLDGTLVDHERAARRASIELLKSRSDVLHFEERAFASMWHELAEKYLKLYTEKKMTYTQQRVERIKIIYNKMGKKIGDDEALGVYKEFLGYYEKNWELFDDVLPCLEKIDDYPKGVISNGDYKAQVKKLKAVGIREKFKTVVTSELAGVPKPDSYIFRSTCEKAGEKPGDSVYIGDKLMSDARGAKDAGLRGIWLDRKNESLGIEGVEVIKSLDELIGVL